MTIEIERRFLVSNWRAAVGAGGMTHWQRIRQGYFGRWNGLRVRVRIATEATGKRRAVLTFKGPRLGPCRLEYEYPLAIDAALRALRSLPEAQIIRKIRYDFRHDDGLLWSIDRFQGANAGLVIAEVELGDPEQAIGLPPWVGAEITLDGRYGNSRLARRPQPRLANAA